MRKLKVFLINKRNFQSCMSTFNRLHVSIETALNTADLSIDPISSVVLVSGGTRVPKIQKKKKISAYVKKNRQQI